jgi:uncharacterized membrane protein
MAKSPSQWLHEQAPEWVRRGLISPEQADAIRGLYPPPPPGRAWGTIVFASLGAVVVGLGVILLFAYNWQSIPRGGKLALVLGGVAAAHAAGLRLHLAGARFRALGDGMCLLGTMLFGAGIWLVAQIYHIQEHYPNAFLFWGGGAILMAWALPSVSQAMLSAALLTIWCGTESLEFHTAMYAAPLMLLFAVGPLAWIRRSRALLAVLLPALLLSSLFILLEAVKDGWLILATFLSLGALWIAAGGLVRRYGAFPGSSAIWSGYGWAVCYLILFLMGFPSLCREMLRHPEPWTRASIACWLPVAAACLGAWGWRIRDRLVHGAPPEEKGGEIALYVVPLAVLLALADAFVARSQDGWVSAGPFNLVYLGLAASLMARGIREGVFGPTVWGSLLLVALMLARFFDLFHSLFVRGLVFIAVGGILFAEGILYARSRRQTAGGNGT